MPKVGILKPFVSIALVLLMLAASLPVTAAIAGKNPSTDGPVHVETLQTGSSVLERSFDYWLPEVAYNPYLGTRDISLRGLSTTNEEGSPSLPVEHVSIALPPGMKAVTVVSAADSPTIIDIDEPVTPVPREVLSCGGADMTDPGLYQFGPSYSVDGYYPGSVMTFSESFGLTDPAADGPSRDRIILSSSVRSHYIDVYLHPVRYNPVQGKLEYNSRLTLTVTYSADPAYRGPRADLMAPPYDNVIITSQAFVPTFQVLSDHHNATGIKSTVVSVENIYSGKYFAASATGVDNAEKIKIFIKNATDTWGLKYVTLAGDSGIIPSRHAWVAWDFATDMYYSDVSLSDNSFASWDTNADGKWGNWTDDRAKMDLRPDVHIGRLPAATLAQAQGMVAKVRNYDNTTANKEFYKNVTFLVGPNAGDGTGYTDYLADNVYPATDGWRYNKLYNAKATAANLSIPQNNSVGYMAFWGHGGTDSWLGGETITVADINALNNFNALPVASIMACDCGNFDGPSDGFAETFLKNPNGGALGVLAGTQTSNADDMNTWAGATNKYFHEGNKEHRIRRLGAMYSAGVNMFLDNKNWKSSSLDYKNLVEYVLFGDPAATLGGFSTTHAKINSDNASRTGLPGQNVTFNVFLENTGAGWADVELMFTQPVPQRWSASLPYNFTNILAGENRTVLVNVTIPQDSLAGERLTLVLQANSTNYPESPLSITLTTMVGVNYSFTFSCAQTEQVIGPKDVAVYQFAIKNLGNAEFMFVVSPLDFIPGWDLNTTTMVFYLGPGNTYLSRWNVTPNATAYNRTYQIRFESHISEDETHIQTIYTNTTIRLVSGFELVPNRTVANLVDGDAQFTVLAQNVGNDWAVLKMGIVPSSSTGQLSMGLNKGQATLEAYGNTTFILTVTVPEGTLAGNYTITVGVRQDFVTYYKEINFTVVVEPQSKFYIQLSVEEMLFTPPASFSFDLEILNRGNCDDAFNVSVLDVPAGWIIDYDFNVAIAAHSDQTITIDVSIPAANAPSGSYNLTVAVTSRTFNITQTKIFEAWADRTYALYAYFDVTDVIANPGQTVNMSLHINNLGNGPDTFTIEVMPLAFWYVSTVESLSLGAFENATIYIMANPSPYAGPVSSTLAVTITSQNGPMISQTVQVKTHVNRTVGFEVKYNGGVPEVNTGESFKALFTILNLGNEQDVITVAFGGPKGMILSNPEPVTVVGFQSKSRSFDIQVAKGTKTGLQVVSMTFKSQADPTNNQTISFTVRVNKKVDPNEPVEDMFVYLVAAVVGIIIVFVAMILLLMRPKGPAPRPKAPTAPAAGQVPPPAAPPPPGPAWSEVKKLKKGRCIGKKAKEAVCRV